MSDFLWDKAREDFSNAAINLGSDTIKIILAKSTYVASQGASNPVFSDVSGSDVIATATLGSKTTTSGVFDAADVTYSAVAGGSTGTQLVIYKDTGVAGTSRLIAHIDSYSGLPVVTNGGDITITFPNDANKIFKL